MISSIFTALALTFVWIILNESFSPATIITGIVISIGCVYFSHKYLPAKKIGNVNFLRLALYPFYLIGQVYLSAFVVIKIILTGAKVDVVEVDTKITNDFLKDVLSISITLTPGSILLYLRGEKITVLRLRGINATDENREITGDLLKGKLEKMLLKIQKQG